MTTASRARRPASKAGRNRQAATVMAATAAGAIETIEAIDANPTLAGPNPFVGLRPEDFVSTAQQIGAQCVQEPVLVLEQQAQLAHDLVSVLDGSAPLPSARDRRFGDAAWRDNPLYRMSLQGYQAWRDALGGFVRRSVMDARSKHRAQYFTELVIDALAPTNTLLGNPAALRRTVESCGMNLVSGLANLVADTLSNGGMPAQVDKEAFRVGQNLATTPGAVVFRNEVLELIQYAPSTARVHARPQLIVPPQVNKFYVFDLASGKSMVEYLLAQELQVFIVSWRNPTAAQRDWNLDTYVSALIEAIGAIRAITGSADVNLHGACSGAMTMAALMGYCAASGEKLVHAATLMVSVFGLDAESQLGLFSTPEAVTAARQGSQALGVLDGAALGRIFAWLRPNDLVWNYWVNNYLLGNAPPAFDVLYWNNDTTRLPAGLHGQFLDMLTMNQLATPRTLHVLGHAITLSDVTCDKYVLAGMTDHITPWKAVYRSMRAFGGRTEFVLSSSGHVQSLVNPPGNPKAKFFRGGAPAADPQAWLDGATAVQDSWWEHWSQWLQARSGPKRRAPDVPGSAQFAPCGEAPGRYVTEA
ncbi:Poly(3-hydroxyalkanoate) polymerase 1 (plasmid) [Cupriavidus neocaledonicus]|uniref:Poly(3-hydroxyalkanoate) polymerase 1 n=2 Tax=Cupriavidus neocaledonicus TaxID=1040979 RepID=A0A375HSQ4_9BURK|nr:Poly(3-hydroxyalkanoate) polymerase 1 (PHA polymerase 1) [Cupriavidus neocaledonicus]SPD60952.1 Poly(3-hydroxyalkanoate) polymerase 1 [Cupriavidus neocaledonicus]